MGSIITVTKKKIKSFTYLLQVATVTCISAVSSWRCYLNSDLCSEIQTIDRCRRIDPMDCRSRSHRRNLYTRTKYINYQVCEQREMMTNVRRPTVVRSSFQETVEHRICFSGFRLGATQVWNVQYRLLFHTPKRRPMFNTEFFTSLIYNNKV